MKFIEVKDIPHENRGRSMKHKMRLAEVRLEEFMAMNIRVAKIEYEAHEYAYPASCRSSMCNAIRISGFPIRTVMEDGVVYLIRTDM